MNETNPPQTPAPCGLNRLARLRLGAPPDMRAMMFGYLSLWLGLIMIATIVVPFGAIIVVVSLLVQDAGFILTIPAVIALFIIGPWFAFRFVFPATFGVIRRRHYRSNQLERPTPKWAVNNVLDQLAVLKRDLRFVFSKIGARFHA